MRIMSVALFVVLAFTAAACKESKEAAPGPSTSASSTASTNPSLPPSEQTATSALQSSPRHGEFVDVPVPGQSAVRAWIVYPERPDKAGVVILIHEIFGLSDWMRGVADQLAREGFIAIAPDLISGHGPGGGGTDSVASRDDVVKLVRSLTPEEIRARLDATRDYARKIPAANGKFATIGFCWGGGQSFQYAASRPAPAAAVVFYGTSPDSATILSVEAPVQGHYGGDDARVDATIEPAKAALAKRGKFYEPHIYPGAGHGFLRQQDGRDGANLKATQEAWPLTVQFLRKHLS
jgi:carboxymethylenebutenolidase